MENVIKSDFWGPEAKQAKGSAGRFYDVFFVMC